MSLQLAQFPVVPGSGRVSFQDSFGALRRHSGLTHQAIDISAAAGTSVICATDGLVIEQWVTKKNSRTLLGCGWSDAGGNIVVVLDSNGFAHYYAHLQGPPLVSSGTRVTAGRPLGSVGNSGSIARGSLPHLHYQVWVVGANRQEEIATGRFTRHFGRAVNPYRELHRLAPSLG
jgi:murein DD-endopeptidase MepM/ murein hydrolase activator NlpD